MSDDSEPKALRAGELHGIECEQQRQRLNLDTGQSENQSEVLERVLSTQEKHGAMLSEIMLQLKGLANRLDSLPEAPIRHLAVAEKETRAAAPEEEAPAAANGVAPAAAPDTSEVALILEDKEVRNLLEQDQAFDRILQRLQQAKAQSTVTEKERTRLTLHPDSKFVSVWELILACVLMWTCVIVPLKLAFPGLFDGKVTLTLWLWLLLWPWP